MINNNKPIDAESLNPANPAAVSLHAPGVTNTSTTNFVDDTQVASTSVRNTITNYSMGPKQHDRNSIADFLAKPYLLQNGFVSTASSINSILYSSNIGPLLTTIPIYSQKVTGYNLIRATAVVRVVLNAQPFQQGRLLLHFIPCASHLGSNVLSNHLGDLCTKTQQPSVELDFQSGAVEMEIPYITPTSYYDLSRGVYDWGRFYLSVLSPMKVGSAGSTSVEYSVFIYFKDVELAAPVYFAQSGDLQSSAKRVRVKMSRVMDSEEKDAETNPGWLSRGLSSASEVAGALSTIPWLAPIASPGKAVFSGLSTIAKFFGWSKPYNIGTISYFQQHVGRNNHNFDTTNNADVLTMAHDAKVPPYEGVFGLDEDEMSFAYLKAIPALVDTFNVTTLQVNDTSVYVKKINPQILHYTPYSSAAGALMYPRPPFGHISNLFGQWRGGVKVTFKPVKTSFHSLRCMVTFTPANQVNVSNASSAYSLREIIDIKTSDEFTFTLPYLLNTQYADVTDRSSQPSVPLTNYCSGVLEVRILNELRAPETCAQNIDFLVYYSAAPDFEYTAYNPKLLGNYEVQSGQIGNSMEDDVTLHNNLSCSGDPFLSLKQLTNISHLMVNMQPLEEDEDTSLIIQPFALSNWQFTLGAARNAASDVISFLTNGYAFSRGGVRITIPAPQYADYVYRSSLMPADTQDTAMAPYPNQFISRRGYPSSTVAAATQETVSNAIGMNLVLRAPLNTFRKESQGLICDAVVPHMAKTPFRLNAHSYGIQSLQRFSELWAPIYNLVISVAGGGVRSVPTYNSISIYRSGADDFCLGYFYGFPPFGEPNVF